MLLYTGSFRRSMTVLLVLIGNGFHPLPYKPGDMQGMSDKTRIDITNYTF